MINLFKEKKADITKFIINVILLLISFLGKAQINNQINLAYGIYSFHKVQDITLYSSTKTTGVVCLSYSYNFSDKIDIGLAGTYERINPVLRATGKTGNEYVETLAGLGFVSYLLAQRNDFVLYVSAKTGFAQEKSQLQYNNETRIKPVYELVFVGIKYNFTTRYGIFSEIAKSDLCLAKFGLCFGF